MRTVPNGAGGPIPRPLFYARKSAWLGALVLAGSISWATSVAAGMISGEPVVGHASWYGDEFARRPTASGRRFDPSKLTCAHRTLPFGSKVRVTNLRNGRSVMVIITDRGPYARRREIDLSYGAARALGMLRQGVERVRIELLES